MYNTQTHTHTYSSFVFLKDERMEKKYPKVNTNSQKKLKRNMSDKKSDSFFFIPILFLFCHLKRAFQI
jgi:hypothetical protein